MGSLFADGERFTLGEVKAFVLLSPGHTLCSITYVSGTRLLCMIRFSCRIWVRRELISPEVTLDSCGGA